MIGAEGSHLFPRGLTSPPAEFLWVDNAVRQCFLESKRELLVIFTMHLNLNDASCIVNFTMVWPQILRCSNFKHRKFYDALMDLKITMLELRAWIFRWLKS